MKTHRNHLIIYFAIALLVGVVNVLPCRAVDTVVLTNGKVINGAIIRLDSLSLIIVKWEDRNALFPRGEVYGKDEIQAITFNGRVPVFGAEPGEKYLSIRKGVWELSLAASFRALKPDSGKSTTFMNVPLRAGYFLARNLSTELEIIMSQPKGGKMGYLMTVNGLIHPRFKLMNPRPWFRGFLLLGFGFGTAAPEGDVVPSTANDPMNIIQGGIGAKIGDGPVALRVEYRITSLFGKQETYNQGINNQGQFYAYRDDVTHNDIFHSITVGFSVFLGHH
jgi:hypothetical protein